MSLISRLNLPDAVATEKLITKAQAGDEDALNKLCSHFLILVEITVNSMVRSQTLRSMKNDLVQEGAIGLIRAIRRFNPTLGTSFTTYAISMIQGYIRNGIHSEMKWFKNTCQVYIASDDGEEFGSIETILATDLVDAGAPKNLAAEASALDLETVLRPKDRKFIKVRYGL